MAEKFSRWDSADYLKTDEDIALSAEGNPSFATVLKVAHAMGLTLHGGPLVASDAKANA